MACPRVKKPRLLMVSAFAAAAVTAGLCCAPLPTQAATLDELQAQIDSCSAVFDDAVTRANELQDQIASNEERVAAIQGELPGKREAASKSLRTMYKLRSNAMGVIELLLSSESFNEVISTVQYLDAVVSHNNAAIDGLVSASDELDRTREELETEKAQADAEVASAMDALTQASQAREQYETQLAAEKAAAEAAAQAEKEAQEKAAAEAAAQEQAAQDAAAADSTQETPSDKASGAGQGNASSSATANTTATDSSSSSSSKQDVKDDGEWMSGLASAYDIEDNTGGTATASGIPLTHDSMTVAVPVSQSYLLGRSVEIRYAGKTITATVTDTGGFASYGRVLDLAGGCWQAFGFSSGDDWGVRAVQYRFL